MRIPNVTRAMINLAGVRLRRAERHWRTAKRLLGRVGRHVRRQQELLARAPTLARERIGRSRAAVERSRKRVVRFGDHVIAPYRVERRVKKSLRQGAAGGGPVIVGPWTSEVGYEALYWVPFLAWAADRYGIKPDRMVVLSRGGTASWYRGIAERYVEIFDLVERAKARLGLRDATVWHPGLMYQLFRAFWYGDRSLDFLLRHTDFRAIQRGESPTIALPTEYVAVKFYTGPAIPDTDANRALIFDIVRRVAARIPVVVLDTAWSMDEHRDYAFEAIPGVTTLRPSLDPRSNLGLQTQVIAGARRFIGTCGGLAWLAPFLGVDTLAVYEDDRYLTGHLYVAKYAYRRTGAARLSTLNLRALGAVERFSWC
jgi:hypothetical protein